MQIKASLIAATLAFAISVLSSSYEADFANIFLRSSTDLQTFTEALGGATAPSITNSGDSQRPFEVQGNTFTDFESAGSRTCSIQHNDCADMSNNKTGDFTVGQCDTQQTACLSAQASATATSFQVLVSQDANFDYFCDS